MKKLFFLLFSLITLSFYSQSLTTSLTACYALNGTGVEPINNFTGTLSAVTPTLDRFNNPNSAFAFSGNSGSFIELPDNPLLKPTNAISFSCWVRMNTLAVGQYIIFNKNTVFSNFEAYTINVATQFGAPKFRVQKGAGGLTTIVDGTTTALINTWYHIAGTIDNSSVNLYVNGVLENSLPTALPFSYVPGKRVILGGSNEPSFNLPFNGSIDNVRFYNRMLTPAEVNQLYLTDPACVTSISNPNCNSSFYAQATGGIFESGLTVPNTSTLVSLPPASSGFAVGPAFGFPAPNPTFWTTIAGNFAYYDGTNFINTGHSTSNAGAVNIGGSKNLIYNLVGATGQVYKYNGTGPATLVATIPALAGGGPYDLVGDDQDNFYYLRTQPPQSLNVYDPTGVLTCSYSITGILPATAGGGFSIVGNTVTAHTGTAYYVGTIAGSVVNFTNTPSSFASPSDFANCHLVNTFSSNITGNPSASLTCLNPTLTLTASSTLSPNSYTWTGPGILTPINNQTVLVNVAGVYTCSLTSLTGCPVKTSVATFTVINSGGILTPTITSTGSLSCTNPTTQLIVSPNSPTNTIVWSGPGIVGANNTATIIANAAGIYSVTLTSTLCSGTATFNLASGVGPLTLIPSPASAQICSSSGPVTLSVTGAANYTWAPAASLIPSTGSVVAANPGVTTTYTINGVTGVCSGSAIITVSVNATPTVIITSGIQTVCAGNSATLSASGAASYTWNPGASFGSPISVSPLATTIYTVIGANGSCTASATTTVVVVPSPTIFTLASPASVCQGVSTNILAAGALSYTWQPGNLSGALITVTPAISTVYTVSGTNAAGCVGTSTVLINVDPNPTITINPASPTICAGSSATLTATGAVNYTWTPGAIVSSSLVVTPASSTSYTVNGDDGTCPGSSTVLVTVVSNPTVTASASNTLICLGGSSTLSAIGAGSYTWNPGNLSGSSVTVSPLATTVYTVTGGTGICSDTKTISITVNNGPTVTVVSSPTSICSTSGSSATLTASGALSYTWNPGAVVASSLVITPTVTSTFSVGGTNGLGCVSTTTLSYSVTPTPTINVSSSSTAICAGNAVTLSATGAASYTWNPGALSGGTVTAAPATNTTYTVTGSNGNCTSTATIAIIVNSNPTITAGSSPTLICSGSSSTLTAAGALTFTWNPGALNGSSVSVSPGATTNYTVTGTNASGCTATAVANVSVNITPTLNPIATPTAICIGGTSTLSSAGATSYTWNPGNLSGASVTVAPLATTNYTVIGSTSGCFDTKTVSVIVNPLPVISGASSPTAICAGSTATLTGSGGSTYTWTPGPLTGVNVTVSPAANTTYTVVGTNSLGCSNFGTVSLIVNANPTITAVTNPTSICSGSGASATLTAGGALSYTWNPGALLGSPVIVNPTATTVYTVTGTNASGCVSTKTVSILITPSPTITISGNPAPLCRGSSSTLTANGAASYTWLPGGSTATNIVVSPTATTVYTVIGVSGNCSSTKTFTLVVLPRPNINITTLPPVICNGGSALLLAFGATSYTWNPGSAVGNTIIVSPSVTTSYTVTGSNLAGCTNTAVTTVSVNPNPTITTVPSSTLVCSGNSVTLVSSGGVTYLVNPGALTGPIVVVSPTVTTTYTVTGLNNFGCTDTETVTITVGGNPTITASASNSLLCDGGSFTLSATGATNYTWMPIALTGSTVVTTATNSINTYTVIGENGGCSSVATVSVFVISCNNTMFGMTKAAGKPVLVYNTFYNVDFTVTAVNASTINLTNVTLNEDLGFAFPMPSNFSVVSQPVITSQNSSLSINPLFDGVSQISLTSPSTSTLLANKRDTIVFTVRIDPKGFYGPFKNWVIGFADFINNVTVMDTSNNGFTWDPDFDGDPTNNDTVTIINLTPIDLFIPDGFSPDGDGKNDVFFIKGLNGRPVKLTIFNRWGNKVYEKSEYDNSWNGLVNATGLVLGSNKVPPATYYYIIEFLDGEKETRTGFVVVQY